MNFQLHSTRLIVEKIFLFPGFICSFANYNEVGVNVYIPQ